MSDKISIISTLCTTNFGPIVVAVIVRKRTFCQWMSTAWKRIYLSREWFLYWWCASHSVDISEFFRFCVKSHLAISKSQKKTPFLQSLRALIIDFGQIHPSKKCKNLSKSKFRASKNVILGVFAILESLHKINFT